MLVNEVNKLIQLVFWQMEVSLAIRELVNISWSELEFILSII